MGALVTAPIPKIVHADAAANRAQDELLRRLNPILQDGVAPSGAWQPLPLASGWSAVDKDNDAAPAYRVQSDGSVFLKGIIQFSGAVKPDTAVAVLPAALSVGERRVLPCTYASVTVAGVASSAPAALVLVPSTGGCTLQLHDLVGLTWTTATVSLLSIEAHFRG